jgi:uncharacterized membrane protein YphA (DoxX/SURF4 family)
MNYTAKVMLVLLRIGIGWHFLYEGLFKLDAPPAGQYNIVSRSMLQANTARLRDGLDKPDAMARADQWHDDIVKHFKSLDKPLDELQKSRLGAVRDEVKLALAEGHKPEVDWAYIHGDVLKLETPEAPRHFTAVEYLHSSAGPLRGVFRGLVTDIDGVERLTPAAVERRIDRQHDQILRHFRDAGQPFTSDQAARLAASRDSLKQSVAATLAAPEFAARKSDYQAMLARVNGDAARTDAFYSKERLDADRKKLDTIAGEMLGLVNEPLYELALQAQMIATPQQMQAGPPPPPEGQTPFIDAAVRWGLTLIGACLLAGLFTPVAALAAAAQLAMFYFASPPWPGLPAAATGGHYLFVDRNLIEMIAVLVIFATPTGRWAGLDAYLFNKRRTS